MFFDYQKVKNVKIQVEISIMSDISYFSDGMDNSRDIYGLVAQPLLKFFYNNIYNLRDTYILIPFMPKDQFQATYFLGHKYTVYGK